MTEARAASQPESPGVRRRRGGASIAAFALVGLFVLLLAVGLSLKSPRTGIDERLQRGELAKPPGFDLALLQTGVPGRRLSALVDRITRDGRVSSTELRGTPYVLNFWASWCLPCRVEAPRLEAGWRAARRRGVLFVGLNQQDLTSDARDFMRRYRQRYLNVRDPQNDVALAWGVTGIPETYFVTRSGLVAGHVIGVVSAAQLAEGIDAAAAGRVAGESEGGAREPQR